MNDASWLEFLVEIDGNENNEDGFINTDNQYDGSSKFVLNGSGIGSHDDLNYANPLNYEAEIILENNDSILLHGLLPSDFLSENNLNSNSSNNTIVAVVSESCEFESGNDNKIVRSLVLEEKSSNMSYIVKALDTTENLAVGSIEIVSNVMTTAIRTGAGVATSAGSFIPSVPVLSTLVGCASETIIYTSDYAQRLADQYVMDMSIDSPESADMKALSCETKNWDELNRRILLPSLPWLERQLIQETKDTCVVPDIPLAPPCQTSPVIVKPIKIEGKIVNTDSTLKMDPMNESSIIKPNHKIVTGSLVATVPVTTTTTTTHSSEKSTSSSLQQWLLKEAQEGDEEAQYALSRQYAKPIPHNSNQCHTCHKQFGLSLFRHHCCHCGKSFCSEHSNHTRSIPRFGIALAVRVCIECMKILDAESRVDRVLWRLMRVKKFLEGNLLPYFGVNIDSTVDKAMRVAEGTLYVARNTLSLSYYTKLTIDAIQLLTRYGMAGLSGVLLRNDFVEAVETLKKVSSLEVQHPLSLHELTACLYYKLALDRGIRGCDADAEHLMHIEHHRDQSLLPPEQRMIDSYSPSDQELNSAIRFASLAMLVIYEEQPADLQRLARLQGWSTICVHNDAAPEKPAFALFGSLAESRKEVVLAVRGTASLQDIVTDIRTIPQRFPPSESFIDRCLSLHRRWSSMGLDAATGTATATAGSEGVGRSVDGGEGEGEESAECWEWDAVPRGVGYACGGVCRAACWLLAEIGPVLLELHAAGREVVVTGHSLGAAVAVLLTAMLRARVPGIRCWAYGCPCVVDESLADVLRVDGVVTTVVVHDDIIPRLTPSSIRSLHRDLLLFREHVFRHVEEDWSDVLSRASALWTPRWRREVGDSSKGEEEGGHGRDCRDKEKESVLTLLETSKSNSSEKQNDEHSTPASPPPPPGGGDVDVVHVPDRVLADVWLPGRVLHLHSHRGVFLATYVARTLDTLRRIEVQGNIFEDHKAMTIFNSLVEARAVRGASEYPREWTPFNARISCELCDCSFTWHTTCQGQAQDLRERHNCRCCGALVCDPCSNHRTAIPSLGLLQPVRICDKCFLSGRYSTL